MILTQTNGRSLFGLLGDARWGKKPAQPQAHRSQLGIDLGNAGPFWADGAHKGSVGGANLPKELCADASERFLENLGGARGILSHHDLDPLSWWRGQRPPRPKKPKSTWASLPHWDKSMSRLNAPTQVCCFHVH